MTDAEALLAVAQRLGRLRPDWQRPERFFEERSELAAELRRLANTAPTPTVKRVLVPVERVVERIVYVPAPVAARRRRRSAQPEAPTLPNLLPEETP